MKTYILIALTLICSLSFGAIKLGNTGLTVDGTTIGQTSSSGSITFDPGSAGFIFTDLTATTVPYLGSSKEILSSAVTPTELGYVSGVTSAIQTQMDTKLSAQMTVVSKTTTYLATTSDDIINVDATGGAWTLSLYAASGNAGRQLIIKRTDTSFTNAVTIDPNGAETIDGQIASRKLYTINESFVIVCDGSGWKITSHHIPGDQKTFTPAWTGITVGNGTQIGRWHREKNFMVGWVSFVMGSTSSITGSPKVTVPGSLTIDTTWQPDNTSNVVGVGAWIEISVATWQLRITATSDKLELWNHNVSTGGTVFAVLSATAPATWATSDALHFNFKIPITGWDEF